MLAEISDEEWKACLELLESNGRIIEGWPDTDPDPAILRCEFSRHRTLAHLRAAQETWLEGVLLFAEKDKVNIVRLHPWRLFEQRGYGSVSWHEHRDAFLRDREEWLSLVQRPGLDRNRGGKFSRQPQTIGTLTRHLVYHEAHHIAMLRSHA